MIHIDRLKVDYEDIDLIPHDTITLFNRRAIILKIYYATPQMIPWSVDMMFLDTEEVGNYFVKDLVAFGAIEN
jgi:hypothetical protein